MILLSAKSLWSNVVQSGPALVKPQVVDFAAWSNGPAFFIIRKCRGLERMGRKCREKTRPRDQPAKSVVLGLDRGVTGPGPPLKPGTHEPCRDRPSVDTRSHRSEIAPEL